MQEAAKSSTAFGRIRSFDEQSFESLVVALDVEPSHVKPMAKKLPKKSKGAVGAEGVSTKAAPCKRPAFLKKASTSLP